MPIAAIHGPWHLEPVVPKRAPHAALLQCIAVMKKDLCQVRVQVAVRASGEAEVPVWAVEQDREEVQAKAEAKVRVPVAAQDASVDALLITTTTTMITITITTTTMAREGMPDDHCSPTFRSERYGLGSMRTLW